MSGSLTKGLQRTKRFGILFVMKTYFLMLLLLGTCARLFAQSLTLWPSDLCEVQQHADSVMAIDPTKIILVTTGTTYTWPGVTVLFKAGEMDLSAYGPLNITVSNTSSRAITVSLSVKNHVQKGGSPAGSVSLQPGAADVITASLRQTPWVLDKPLELVGMRGYPASLEGGTFNVRKTAELHIFVGQFTEPASFAILKIEAVKKPLELFKADTFMPFVDKFGQFAHADWPGKVHSEEELLLSKTSEAAWLDAQPESFADRDAWGGWTRGPRLRASGHFRTEKINGKWWLVDPDGRLFFSHGVDCVRPDAETGVQFRETYFSWLPEKDTPAGTFYGRASFAAHGFYKDKKAYKTFDFARSNLLRKYGADWYDAFAALAHRRIHAWGLNTVANWSDSKVYLLRHTPYTAWLHTGGPRIEGSEGWWRKFPDPYSQAFGDGIRKQAEAQKNIGTAEDPWCIGYFVDNELSGGKDDRSLARSALRSPVSQPAKIAFRSWLETKYATPAALNTAWGTTYATWDAFLTATNIPSETLCGADLEAFHMELAERYFRVIRDAVKAAAPNKLYLGCRIAWSAPSVFRAAAKYCDVVSVNIYEKQVTHDLPEGSADKPMINGEFHFGALDRGMFSTGLVATKDQQDRAACYINFVKSCLAHPRFVGTHWFQWRDQALTGRSDSENYQIGFLSVTDQPYPELVAAARQIGSMMYETRFGQQGAASAGILPAVSTPASP